LIGGGQSALDPTILKDVFPLPLGAAVALLVVPPHRRNHAFTDHAVIGHG
jgi:hypothetical protein